MIRYPLIGALVATALGLGALLRGARHHSTPRYAFGPRLASLPIEGHSPC